MVFCRSVGFASPSGDTSTSCTKASVNAKATSTTNFLKVLTPFGSWRSRWARTLAAVTFSSVLFRGEAPW
jgi:hypothetical protein